jgi:hypothetical protein
MVVSHPFSIECDKSFHGRQGTRDVDVTVEGAVVEERIAAMQHPSVAGIDGHAGVAAGVAGQRDQHYPGRDLVKFLGRGEASPLLPSRIVFNDLGLVCPLSASVPRFLELRR